MTKKSDPRILCSQNWNCRTPGARHFGPNNPLIRPIRRESIHR